MLRNPPERKARKRYRLYKLTTVVITEHEIKLNKPQKPIPFFGPLFSLISMAIVSIIAIFMKIFVIIVIPVLIITMIIIGIYLGIIDWLFLKITGKERKQSNSNIVNPFANLPISVEFIYLTGTERFDLITKYNLEDDDIYETNIGKIITEPVINDIEGRYFEHKPTVFQGNIFVEEIKLPDFKTNIGYLDTQNLTYNIIKEFDSCHLISFKKEDNELNISWFESKGKGSITVN